MIKNHLLAVSGAALTLIISFGLNAQSTGTWVAEGPGPNTDGQVEGIQDGEVIGSINSVATHPTDPDTVYIGATNGGVWRTENALDAMPDWTRLTDTQAGNSIGSLEFDPLDATHSTLVAGIGRFSSIGRRGGERVGILRTIDQGLTWSLINGNGQLLGCNIKGIAARGEVLVVAVDNSDAGSALCGRGIFRSSDGGASWALITNGIPAGTAFDLVGDPLDNDRLFTNIVAGAGSGIFRSDDQGASWTRVSDAAVETAITDDTNNLEMAMGLNNNIFAVITNSGVATDVFASQDGGASWTRMDTPAINGLGSNPGGQGSIHLSIAVDRTDANIVYLGGDRQDFPNIIGANDFSGRLFRGDLSQPAGSQWVHLTHDSTLGPAGGGTANDSAPHADSRDMALTVDNVLIEVDDGGVYRRSSPLNDSGDWFSMNGNIMTTEFHAVSFDGLNGIIIGGTQDTGTPEQQIPFDPVWDSVATADGGVTLADDSSTPGNAIRYSSNQFLGSFRRRTFDNNNALVSQAFPARTPLNDDPPISAQFYTPLKLNSINPVRIIFGGANGVYESLDQGDTVSQIGPGIAVNQVGRQPIAYGAAGNEELLYVGSGDNVFTRLTADPAPLLMSATYPGSGSGRQVADIVIPPDQPNSAFVIDSQRVYQTTDNGTTWSELTNNLGDFDFINLRAMVFVTSPLENILVVGSDRGVYAAFAAEGFSNWIRVIDGLPNAPVYDLEYDADTGVLLAGLLGRGAWTLTPASPIIDIFFAGGFEATL